MNQAQKLLVAIGGTAELVAGHMGHYYADAQTPKKEHARTFKRNDKQVRGNYGRDLLATFAARNLALIHAKKRSKDIRVVSTLLKSA